MTEPCIEHRLDDEGLLDAAKAIIVCASINTGHSLQDSLLVILMAAAEITRGVGLKDETAINALTALYKDNPRRGLN